MYRELKPSELSLILQIDLLSVLGVLSLSPPCPYGDPVLFGSGCLISLCGSMDDASSSEYLSVSFGFPGSVHPISLESRCE